MKIRIHAEVFDLRHELEPRSALKGRFVRGDEHIEAISTRAAIATLGLEPHDCNDGRGGMTSALGFTRIRIGDASIRIDVIADES